MKPSLQRLYQLVDYMEVATAITRAHSVISLSLGGREPGTTVCAYAPTVGTNKRW